MSDSKSNNNNLSKSRGFNESRDSLRTGLRQMLGLDPFTQAAEVYVDCIHESDGHVYAETPKYITLMCTKCGIHYDEPV